MTEDQRHYCRNARCRAKMKSPVTNPNAAFCCAGCFDQYHRERCVVCDGAIRQPNGGGVRYLCGRRVCRATYLPNPKFYRPFSHREYEPATPVAKRSQSIKERPSFVKPKLSPDSDREAFERLRAGRVLSRWEPCANPDPNDPGFEIPEFLQRS